MSPPDGRAYELVSPSNKLGGVPNYPPVVDLGFINFVTNTGASSNGDDVIWFSTASFANATSAIPMNYESSRTATGWQTKQLSPDPTDAHPNALLSISQVLDMTDDFSKRIIATQGHYDPNDQGLFRRDLYLQTPAGALSWLSQPVSGPAIDFAQAEYGGRDATASHVVFTSTQALDPVAASEAGPEVYDRTGGQTVIVSVDNGGTPIGNCGAVLGFVPLNGSPLSRVRLNSVSQDGSHIFFTTPNRDGGGDPSCSDPTQLYLRLNGTSTVHVSASQRTIADPSGTRDASFQGASADGSKAFFLSSEALTNDAADGDGSKLLYEYDVATDTLTLLTPNSGGDPRVDGVLALSQDASRLYFIAESALAPGAAPNAANLYMYDGGQTSFVATLSDTSALLREDTSRQVRTTADAGRVLFATSSNLTAYDSAGKQEIYLYDASQNQILCLSCPEVGVAAAGDAFLTEDSGGIFSRFKRSRNLTSDGQRAFFETPQSLVPRDDNGLMDVYEWVDGSVRLISGGHGTAPSYFIDSAREGSDVFFTTPEQLVPQDIDVDPDIYDARTGGGFPSAPGGGSAACVDDQCQGQPSGSPTLPDVASQSDFGLGNVAPGRRSRLSVRAISAHARSVFARTGTLTLTARVGRSGTARAVASAKLGKRMRLVARRSVHIDHAGVLRLRLRLSDAATRRLASAGRLKVTIVVTFPGAPSHTATLVLTPSTSGKR